MIHHLSEWVPDRSGLSALTGPTGTRTRRPENTPISTNNWTGGSNQTVFPTTRTHLTWHQTQARMRGSAFAPHEGVLSPQRWQGPRNAIKTRTHTHTRACCSGLWGISEQRSIILSDAARLHVGCERRGRDFKPGNRRRSGAAPDGKTAQLNRLVPQNSETNYFPVQEINYTLPQ